MATAIPARTGARWLADTVRAEYSDATRLLIRERLYGWEYPALDLHGRVADRVTGCTGLVLDVGCGAGRTLERLGPSHGGPAVGVDVSPTMLQATRAGGDRAVIAADVAALPFRDGVASAVLAVHLLYLVADPATALAELARVLGPGGLLVVVTTGDDDKPQVTSLLADALAGVLPQQQLDRGDLHRRCTIAAAETQMRTLGFEVEREDLHAQIRLREAAPLVDYVASMAPRFRQGATPDQWTSAMVRIEAAVAARLAASGAVLIPTHVGILTGRRRR